MSESLGMKVVNRVAKTDRLPFIKTLAYLATVDDSVDLDEKKMVNEYADAWELTDEDQAQVRSILNADRNISIDELTGAFTEPSTRFLLIQELMRLSYADGTYGETERKEIAAIAQRMDMNERQFREVEKWVGRGQAWEKGALSNTDEEDEVDELQEVIDRQEEDDDDEYDLSDIQTTDSDLDEIEPGGYELDEDELDEMFEEAEEEASEEEEEAAEDGDTEEEDAAETDAIEEEDTETEADDDEADDDEKAGTS